MPVQPITKFGPLSRFSVFVNRHKPYVAHPSLFKVCHETVMDSMRPLPVKVSSACQDTEHVTEPGAGSAGLEIGCVAAVMENDEELNDNRRGDQGQEHDDPGWEQVVVKDHQQGDGRQVHS
jgi:hypothetical protein